MFDQLVLTNAHDNAKQARYFGITTLVYGALIMAVMVWSVFSFDLSGLNQDDLAFNELVAPIALPENAPVPVLPDKPQPQAAASNNTHQNFDRIKDPVSNINNATTPPDKISTIKSNATQVRDGVPFIVGKNTQLASDGSGFPDRSVNSAGSNLAIKTSSPQVSIKDDESAPEAPKTVTPVKKDITVSKGVINGIAANLPKPAYPSVARAMHAGGEVKVQVLIDERGNVVSANAVSGHPLLRAAAQAAAHQAKFTPTQLSNQPVKVTGVIIYNFVAQ